MGDGFYRVTLHYGFMEETDVPAALEAARQHLQRAVRDDADELLPLAPDADHRAKKPGMAIWREKLFAWMMRNAATPMEFFRLPTNRVVELGSQVEI